MTKTDLLAELVAERFPDWVDVYVEAKKRRPRRPR